MGEMDNPRNSLAELRDSRVKRNRKYLLDEILLFAIAAVLSGAESWNNIADYGQERRQWLQTILFSHIRILLEVCLTSLHTESLG